ARLGISKVMTMTSTYDHRVIQGAESGAYLARVNELLLGKDGFYESVFSELGLPVKPLHWALDRNPAFLGGTGDVEAHEKQAQVLALINMYRVRGHLIADIDPLGLSQSK